MLVVFILVFAAIPFDAAEKIMLEKSREGNKREISQAVKAVKGPHREDFEQVEMQFWAFRESQRMAIN